MAKDPVPRDEVLKIVSKLLDPRGRYFGDILIKNAMPGQAGNVVAIQSVKEANQVSIIKAT